MPVKQNLRIGIDCRLAGNQHAGIGRYTENLVRELLELTKAEALKQRITWVLFFFDQKQARQVLGPLRNQENLEVRLMPVKHYGLAEQITGPSYFQAAHLDLLHVPHFNIPIFYRGKLVITIHDLLWHEQRGRNVTTLNPILYSIKYRAYLWGTKIAVNRALKIFVPSKTIQNTILKYYPLVNKKILISKEGISDIYRQEISKRFVKKNVRKQFVYTGSLYPHKNLKLVFCSLRKLPKYHLYIVGSRNVFRERMKVLVSRFKVKQQVSFLGRLSDEELIRLYQDSLAAIQPSLSEGFGLTGLEAMASKTLLLASDIPVFHEIYKDSAFYFDPKDSESFVEAVHQAEIADRLPKIKAAAQLAATYSWHQMAKESLKAYLEVA